MPDTPIDLSEGIQSIRLKVPTGPVPIPPEGWGQLHSPAPGELAIRLPDGSVVAVGGGGDFALAARNLLGPNGQVLTNGTEPGVGIDITPAPPLKIRLSGPVEDANGQPQAPDALTLVAPGDPSVSAVARFEAVDLFRLTVPDGVVLNLFGTLGAVVGIRADGSVILGGVDQAYVFVGHDNTVEVVGGGGVSGLAVSAAGALTLTVVAEQLMRLAGLGVVDPHVDGALWIAPITRQLMVSAG